jgi:TusA-related sulfurtransferase
MSTHSEHIVHGYAYLDLKNIKCPISVLKLKSAMKKLHQGQHLKVISSTIGQVNEIKKFCALSNCQVCMEEQKGNCYYVLIYRN